MCIWVAGQHATAKEIPVRTFNKKGDRGETSLLYGVRVAKSDPRCEAYGTIDEAVSALGVARCSCKAEIKDIIFGLQKDLFLIGTELATPAEHYSKLLQKRKTVTAEMVQKLENLIDDFEAKVKMPDAFIVPGEVSVGSASLDLARPIIRRAERRVVSLKQTGLVINEEILKYLNRLADLVFTLARYQESEEKKRR